MLKFLIRPTWLEGESWPGYLLRFANSNHLNGIERLAAHLKLTPKTMLASSPRQICQMLGIPSTAPDLATPVGKVRLKRLVRLSDARRSLYGRICPLCISGFTVPHIPAIWDLSVNLRCEIHRVFLLDQCPACGKQISYKRRRLTHCDCGFQFSQAQCHTETPTLLAMERELGVESLRTAGMCTFATETDSCQAVHRLLRRMLRVSQPSVLDTDLRKQGHFPARLFSHREFDQIAGWFENWPCGFHNNWEAIESLLISGGRPERAKTLLGRSGFSSVDAEIHAIRTGRRRNSSHDHQMSLGWSDEYTGQQYVDLQTCIRMTNMYQPTVQRWIALGWLGDVRLSKMPNGSTKYEIELDCVKAVVGFLSRTSAPRMMAQELGVTRRAIWALMESDVLGYIAISPGFEGRRLNAARAYALADTILRKAIPEELRRAEAVTISAAFERIAERKWCTPALLVRFVTGGKFPVYLAPTAPRTLAHVYCKEEDLHAWIERHRGGGNVQA